MSLPIQPTIQVPMLRCYNPMHPYTWLQRGLNPPKRCPDCQSRHWFDPNWWTTHTPRPARRPVQQSLPSIFPGTTTTTLLTGTDQIDAESDPGPLPEREAT